MAASNAGVSCDLFNGLSMLCRSYFTEDSFQQDGSSGRRSAQSRSRNVRSGSDAAFYSIARPEGPIHFPSRCLLESQLSIQKGTILFVTHRFQSFDGNEAKCRGID